MSKFIEIETHECYICGPSYNSITQPLPCCGIVIHEESLCSYWYNQESLRCPHCIQHLYPLNDGDSLPYSPFPGYLYFQLEWYSWNVPSGLQPQWDRRFRSPIMENIRNLVREENVMQELEQPWLQQHMKTLDYNDKWRTLITTIPEVKHCDFAQPVQFPDLTSNSQLVKDSSFAFELANYESAKKEVEKRVPNLSKERVRVCKINFILCFLFLFRFGGYSYLSTVK